MIAALRSRPAILYTLGPILLSLAVFYPGLQAWFRMDDFAWLGLRLEVHSKDDLIRLLFEPRAQGTIRVLSERAFFLAFFSWFELDALPYRMVVFATHILDMVLIGKLVRRLTGDQRTAFWTVTFWGVNTALSTPLSWTSVYNQTMCTAFLTGALLLFLSYCESGRLRDYALTVAVFIIGFGALEMNVIFPAIAFAAALLYHRKRLLAVLPLFVISGIYTLIHNRVAPKQRSGTYGMYWDLDMFSTLWQYLLESSGTRQLRSFYSAPWTGTAGDAASWILILAVIGYAAWRLYRRDAFAAFATLWFFITIGPVLPLKNHVTLYYLVMPAIGLSMLAAHGVVSCWTLGRAGRLAALVPSLLYLGMVIPVSHAAVKLVRDRSHEVRHLVFGVERARQLHPGALILLTNVSNDMFWWALNDRPFRLIGAEPVFLAPGADELIEKHPGYGTPEDHVLPPGQAMRAIERGEAVVYSVAPDRLTNVTKTFTTLARSRWKPGLSPRVDVGQPAFADQVGSGWNHIESGYRWTHRRAVVWLSGPEKPGEKLFLAGYCSKPVVENGPVHLTVSVDGRPLATREVSVPDSPFEFEIPLNGVPRGLPRIEVALEVDRTVDVPGEPQGLGLVFGTLAIR